MPAFPLEAYLERYPDVPPEVIVKEDLLHQGVRFGDELVADDRSRQETIWYFAQHEFIFRGGPYHLRRTLVQANVKANAPYAIHLWDGSPTLLHNGHFLAEAEFLPRPPYYERTLPDGTPYPDIVATSYGGHVLYALVFSDCHNWDYGEQCRFCDIHKDAQRREGSDLIPHQVYQDPGRVAAVLSDVLGNKEEMLAGHPVAYLLSGGAIRTGLAGLSETDFFLRYVEAVKPRVGNRWPCVVVMRAQKAENLRRLRAAGANVVSHNLEVWDPRLFQIICPGKERSIGRDEWLRRLLEAVSIFGEGHVQSTFVMGVEMARPFGFREVEEAIESTAGGFDFLMAHGVIPKLCNWYISPDSALADQPQPPLDYYIRIVREWYRLWVRHSLPQPRGLGPMGPGRAIWTQSAFLDMGT